MRIILSLLGVWCFGASAEAGLTLSLSALPGGSEVIVAPGDTFGVAVSLETSSAISGLDLRLRPSSTEVFQVLSLDYEKPWIPRDFLLPHSWIGWDFPYPSFFGPGKAVLGHAEIGVREGALPGFYTLASTESRGYLGRFALGFVPGSSGRGLSILVVPEPANVLGVLLLVWLCLRRP